MVRTISYNFAKNCEFLQYTADRNNLFKFAYLIRVNFIGHAKAVTLLLILSVPQININYSLFKFPVLLYCPIY